MMIDIQGGIDMQKDDIDTQEAIIPPDPVTTRIPVFAQGLALALKLDEQRLSSMPPQKRNLRGLDEPGPAHGNELNQRRWDDQFDLLRLFFIEHGNIDLPADMLSTRRWCAHQRRCRVRGLLSSDKISKLTDIGFQWNGRDGDAAWNGWFSLLMDFKAIHGHCNVKSTDNKKLFSWCIRQRNLKSHNELGNERVLRLSEAGFLWAPPEKEALWLIKYEKMKAFYHLFGHTKFPFSQRGLYLWGRNLRIKKAKGALTPEQIDMLSEIDFDFKVKSRPVSEKRESHWCLKYEDLVSFKEEHGHLNVTRKNKTLWTWCRNQRFAKKTGRLSDRRTEMLDEIGFSWDSDYRWLDQYNRLVSFKRENNSLQVPISSKNLYSWCSTQRHLKVTESISPTRVKLLDEIGFSWSIDDDKWMRKYEDFIVKQDAVSLLWAATQRRLHQKGKLTPNRIELLEKIGFEWEV